MRTHIENESVSELLDRVHDQCSETVGYECPTRLHRTLIKVVYSKVNPNLILQKLYE